MPDGQNALIAFDGAPGGSAKLNYDVPLPGSHSGRRLVKLDFGLNAADWLASAKDAATDLETEAGITRTSAGGYQVDEAKARSYWEKRARIAGFSDREIERFVRPPRPTPGDGRVRAALAPEAMERSGGPILSNSGSPVGLTPYPDGGGVPLGGPTWPDFIDKLRHGIIEVPYKTFSGNGSSTPVDVNKPPNPAFFLIEIYGISSFLGDYGVGRTVKTFTLLPGESTTISMRTWKSTVESTARGSSIIDSHNQSASERFEASALRETTDSSTYSETEEWHAEASASASFFGFGSAKISGGGSGEYHSRRDHFAKQVSDVTQEHASAASSQREMTITSSSERSEERGEETVIERTIKNVNMRRVLNFVFRQLNQRYTTIIHLKEIRLAFSNGRPGSWNEVPLSELGGLLQKFIVPARVDTLAKRILEYTGVIFDHDDKPIKVLDKIEMAADAQDWVIADAQMVGNEFAAPTDRLFYRFKRGSLGQAGAPQAVEGVVMKRREITMQTDSVIVEALLGQADALDEYAMETQEAAAKAKTLQNERELILQRTLNDIADPAKRAEAFAQIICCDKERA